MKKHNLTIDNEYLDKLIFIVKTIFDEYSGMTNDEIISDCIYHYGGTVTEALIDCIYNHSF